MTTRVARWAREIADKEGHSYRFDAQVYTPRNSVNREL